MLLGTSKRNINPQQKLRLSGYATRENVFDYIKENIFLRVYYFSDESKGSDIIFIYGDLLWWGSDYVEAIKSELGEFNIPLDQFIFIASHNHSGPPTSDNFTETLEIYNEEYANFLKENIIIGIKEAKENLESISARLFKGNSNLNVYRRVLDDEGVKMMPNYDVVADNDLTVIAFYRSDSSLKGILLHYPCHANISDENFIQPDFPGVTLRMLDKKFEDSISIFMQGATADLRPNVVLGNSFIAQDYDKVLQFAHAFYQDVTRTMEENSYLLDFDLDVLSKKIKLPLQNLKDASEVKKLLESDIKVEREWANKVLEKNNRNYEMLEVTQIKLSKEANFITFNCELSQEYSRFVKRLNDTYISIAYTNGMIGYVCSKEQILEGGYEPIESGLYFALAGNYVPEIEKIIKEELKTMIVG